MSNDNRQIKFRLFDGPSLVAPFAAVIAEFANPFQATLSATEIRQIWSKLNSAASPLNLARTDESLDYMPVSRQSLRKRGKINSGIFLHRCSLRA